MDEPIVRDFLPIPDTVAPVTDPEHKEVAYSITQSPTDSHALAQVEQEEKGAAQEGHDAEVFDLGWNQHPDKVAKPLLGGLENEELWLLIRRFNKQMYHVKEYPYPLPGKLDLNTADEEEFSPDKLRANLERLYVTVGLSVISIVKHVARLRSWRETRRTSVSCGVYLLAWVLDILVPTLVTVTLVLIVYPPARALLFPPAPLALVDPVSGGVQKPRAGLLGSTDTATGALENHKGEAAEAEAARLVTSIASVAIASASGKHPQSEAPHDGAVHDMVPDPTEIVAGATEAKAKSEVKPTKPAHVKAKVPMETAVWTMFRPILHSVGDVTDTYERFANALSPTPPFPPHLYRLRLAALLVPFLFVSMYITSYMFVKTVTLGFGFAFFGDPIIRVGVRWLNRTIPHWEKLLELRNTVLKGVPTNAQLAITLLRIGEANKAPLPPPPVSEYPPPDEPVELSDDNLRATGAEPPLNATDEELDVALQPDPTVAHHTGDEQIDHAKGQSGGKASKIVNLVKKGIRGTVHTALGADQLKAKAGSETAKRRLGVLPRHREMTGPVDFPCRYEGKKGHVYIATKATIPCVAFSLDGKISSLGSSARAASDLNPIWSIAVGDIKEIRKVGGFGWKARLVVGWALDREIADGLEIVTRRGERVSVTAMVLRDELFNRLVAMGGQKWEAW
ncbi:hypothetical protein K438DRAFT_1725259 [Mycena galopus ATCC 62051]|nr:hypothetical protein K438DRAFT_1725259 [Mycena galopus ATCC 62051]